jgi:hypothetical protein
MFAGLQQYHGYYPSPNSYARPSTAPNHVSHHPFGITGMTPPNGNGNGASPMSAAFPPGSAAASYLAARRPSLTSLSPSFPSIQEDTAGERIAQLDPGSSLSASISPQSGQEGNSLHPDSQFGHNINGYDISRHGMQNTLAQPGGLSDTPPPTSNIPQRPSTAGSPFRYSANSSAIFTAGNDDYPPSLPSHLEDSAAESRRANTSDGFAGLTALSDAGGSWSPDWKSLTQRFGTEIH